MFEFNVKAKQCLPLVSVIIPTYNRKEYVSEAINSVLKQTYQNIEIIVVDDGSTDDTGDCLQSLYKNEIEYFYQSNQGESAARNVAIKHSRGKYVALLDSDDIWLPEKIEHQVLFMERNQSVGLVSCYAQRINAQGTLVKLEPMNSQQTRSIVSLETLILNSPLFCSTVLIRRSCLDDRYLFNEKIRYGEDRDLFLRIAARNEVGFVTEILVCLRSHSDMQTRHILPKEEVERRFHNRTQINEYLLHLFDEDAQVINDLKNRAMAKEYIRAAVSNYLHGDYELGSERLYQAVSLDPDAWQSGEKVMELVFRHAVALGNAKTIIESESFLKQFFFHLPEQLQEWKKRFCRKLLGKLYIEFSFLKYHQQDHSSIYRYVLKGIWYDLSWLYNRGVLSIVLKSAFTRLKAW